MGFFARIFGKNKPDKKKEQNIINNAPIEEKNEDIPQKEETPKIKKPAPSKKSTSSEKPEINKPIKEKPAQENQNKEKQDVEEAAERISTDKSSETVKVSGLSGFFDIKKSRDGRFVFNLYASNKVIIATSQIYSSAQSALNGANSVIVNAKKAEIEDKTLKKTEEKSFPKWEIYKDKAEQFRFRLFASNGSCICHSQGYTTKASCKNGIESIIRTVENVKIDKNYKNKK